MTILPKSKKKKKKFKIRGLFGTSLILYAYKYKLPKKLFPSELMTMLPICRFLPPQVSGFVVFFFSIFPNKPFFKKKKKSLKKIK
jgi:hypothetical protein